MIDPTPFSKLHTLAVRSLEVASELPAIENAQKHWNGLGFSLLGQRFVAPMQEVAEMVRVPPTTNLPGVKSFVVGVANLRGRLLVVLDLTMFFGETSTSPKSHRRVLAVEDDEQYFGFMVDESLGMQHFPREAFTSSDEGVDEKFKPFVNGCYAVGGIVWPVISLLKLAEHPDLESLAAESAA